jgi:hypothetical protein
MLISNMIKGDDSPNRAIRRMDSRIELLSAFATKQVIFSAGVVSSCRRAAPALLGVHAAISLLMSSAVKPLGAAVPVPEFCLLRHNFFS